MSLIPWRNKKMAGGRGESTPLATLRSEMDRLFDTYMREPFGGAMDWAFGQQAAWPAVDVSETDKEITVQAELPGMDPKDIEITISGSHLVLAGEKKHCSERKGDGAYHSECSYGVFRRSFPLPETVDENNVQAQYANGVLTIKLQKTPPANVKRIEVKTA